MWVHPDTFSKYLPYLAFSWISFCLSLSLHQHTATLLHHSLLLQLQATLFLHHAYCLSCFHLYPLIHCSCNVSYFTQTFIMLYALVQLPTSSFYSLPSLPFSMYHCKLGSDAVPLHDGIHLTLIYEYCFHTAPYPLDMVPGRFYSGVHSPFWYSFHSHFHI